ncbi:MAG: hypothetical protein FWE05_01420 [Defluviitaleaceae bacterium]|nr:hypothetical protein [Defluviitaleaceae bacterium]
MKRALSTVSILIILCIGLIALFINYYNESDEIKRLEDMQSVEIFSNGNHIRNLIVGELTQGVEVRQQFQHNGYVSKFSILFATYNRDNHGLMRVAMNINNEEIFYTHVAYEDVSDVVFREFHLHDKVAVHSDYLIEIIITALEGDTGSSITILASDFEDFDTDEEILNMPLMYINDEAQDVDILFRVYGHGEFLYLTPEMYAVGTVVIFVAIFCMVALIVYNRIVDKSDKMCEKKSMIVLYVISASFIPLIFLLNLYSQNVHRANLSFNHLLVWMMLFFIGGLIVYFIYKIIVDDFKGGLLISLLFWVGFWFFENIHTILSRIIDSFPRIFTLALLFVILLVFCAIFLKFKASSLKLKNIFFNGVLGFRVVFFGLCVLVFFNFAPVVWREIQFYVARREREIYFSRNFYVDSELPSPDIYWLWVDGTLSLEVFEQFFNESKDWARAGFENRNFQIYEYGYMAAAGTVTAFPALFSPNFYDSIYGEILSSFRHYLNYEPDFDDSRRNVEILNALSGYGLNIYSDVILNSEFHWALIAADYEIYNILVPPAPFTSAPFHRHYNNVHSETISHFYFNDYNLISNGYQYLFHGNYRELFNLTTPLSLLPARSSRSSIEFVIDESIVMPHYATPLSRNIYRSILNIFDSKLSTFTLVWFPYTHHIPYSSQLGRHTIMFETVFSTIDLILEHNPNAIIVVQSDHGIHNAAIYQRELLELGYTHEEVLILFESAFSAVFIPEQYGGLDAPLHPLNISRELVNRFVGQNYELLP